LESWEELARRLGSLGSRTQKGGGGGGAIVDGGGRGRKKRYCKQGRGCTKCQRIRRDGGFHIGRGRTERRRTRKSWWGRLPAVWWDMAYLECPPLSRLTKPPNGFRARAMLEGLMTAMVTFSVGEDKGDRRSVDEDGGGVDGDEDGVHPCGGVAWRRTGPLVNLSWTRPCGSSCDGGGRAVDTIIVTGR